MNFLGLSCDKSVEDACVDALNKYGCGSCGPRGFYGTIGTAIVAARVLQLAHACGRLRTGAAGGAPADVHLELEERIAEFIGTEDAILYSYDVATPSSVVPAFAKRGDIVVCDEAVSYPLMNGIVLSRSTMHTFRHNDMQDLERVLQQVGTAATRYRGERQAAGAEEGDQPPLHRNGGRLREDGRPRAAAAARGAQGALPLPPHRGGLPRRGRAGANRPRDCRALRYRRTPPVALRSAGAWCLCRERQAAAETAGGVCAQPHRVDIITASLSNSLGSIGGFCCGTKKIVDHQRLNGLGYCFSASLPPFLASAAIAAIDRIVSAPVIVTELQDNARYFRQGGWVLRVREGRKGELCAPPRDAPPRCCAELCKAKGLTVDAEAPPAAVYIYVDGVEDAGTLGRIADACLARGVFLCGAQQWSPLERWVGRALRVHVAAREALPARLRVRAAHAPAAQDRGGHHRRVRAKVPAKVAAAPTRPRAGGAPPRERTDRHVANDGRGAAGVVVCDATASILEYTGPAVHALPLTRGAARGGGCWRASAPSARRGSPTAGCAAAARGRRPRCSPARSRRPPAQGDAARPPTSPTAPPRVCGAARRASASERRRAAHHEGPVEGEHAAAPQQPPGAAQQAQRGGPGGDVRHVDAQHRRHLHAASAAQPGSSLSHARPNQLTNQASEGFVGAAAVAVAARLACAPARPAAPAAPATPPRRRRAPAARARCPAPAAPARPRRQASSGGEASPHDARARAHHRPRSARRCCRRPRRPPPWAATATRAPAGARSSPRAAPCPTPPPPPRLHPRARARTHARTPSAPSPRPRPRRGGLRPPSFAHQTRGR
eukprot:scaffold1942_cov351-Prasinococcus_capsulatus_cf.AAC.13